MTQEAFWTELSLRVRPEAVERAAEALQALTGRGVSIEPAIEALGPDEGYVLDEAAPSRLVAYVRGPVGASRRRGMRRQLRSAGLGDAIAGRLRWRTIREQDWAEAWKAHYDIERVGRIVVRPAWREYAAQPGEVVISLDPGMAFGTGQHPTTRMCLAVLEEQGSRNQEQGAGGSKGTGGTGRRESGQQAGAEMQGVSATTRGLGRVLDLGCGSGILAIAAAALGAESVLAVDTEEQAVAATISNAALNGMEGPVEARLGSMEAVGEDGPFDCILANINAAAVSSLAPAMASKLSPEGWLAAGGVVDQREAGARAALESAGLRIERVMTEGDWRTFVAVSG